MYLATIIILKPDMMKKRTLIIGNFISFALFATLLFLAITSCREEKPKTQTVIIEKPVETPKPVAAPKEKESDGTSLSVGKDGVEFSTKKGAKKTEVIIKE